MWFRNLQIFRLGAAWDDSTDQLAARLARGRFNGGGATDRIAMGWVSPRGIEDELVFSIPGQQIFALGVETKLLPASVVRQYADAKLVEIEKNQGYRPGRNQIREVREQIELELLPRAFSRRTLTYVWVDLQRRTLVIDAASSARADEVIGHLKHSLGEVPVSLLATQIAPGTALTQWLAAGEIPGAFTIDKDAELQLPAQERAAVRYVRHSLDSDEVRAHIAAGKVATRLAITWHDRVSFILTEQCQIKRVAFLDLLKEEAERQSEAGAERFETDFVLMSGQLGEMLTQLVAVLGGESQ